MRWYHSTLLLFGCLLLCGAAPKTPGVSIRFHAEGSHMDGDVFAIPITLPNPPREAHLQTLPVVTEHDVVGVFPFTAKDGTYGTYLQFDSHGKNLVEQYSTTSPHTFLVALVNGRLVTALLVDRPIRDGILTIPFGLTKEEVELLKIRFPQIGQSKAEHQVQRRALQEERKARAREAARQAKAAPKPQATPKPSTPTR